jgi:hypothetical protein
VTRDGTVVVHTTSSVWAHELTQLEATILEQLAEDAPQSLRFVTGLLPEPGVETEKTSQRDVREPTAENRALAEQFAAGIEDPRLREAVSRAASLSLAAPARDAVSTAPSDTLRNA